MAFTEAPLPPKAGPSGTGMSCSLRVSKRGAVFKLYLNLAAQEEHFGKSLADERFVMMVGRGADEGLIRLEIKPDGPIEARKFLKGSVSLTTGAWDLLPKSKREGAAVEVISHEDNAVLIKLPPWARPSGDGGKVAEQHALKKPAQPKSIFDGDDSARPTQQPSKIARMKAEAASLQRAAK